MPGIPFLDNIASYNAANFLSIFIKIGLPIFTICNATVFVAELRTIIGTHKKTQAREK